MSSASSRLTPPASGKARFVCELFGDEAERLRAAGAEYGAKTGRPRRVGPLDVVATRYGVEVQGATELALTKLDVLSDLERIPVCVRYLVDGRETDRFPFPAALAGAKPVLEYMEGWNCSISGVRRWEDLPPAAQRYVLFVEQAVGLPDHLRFRRSRAGQHHSARPRESVKERAGYG